MRGIYILLAVVTALMMLTACPKQNKQPPKPKPGSTDQQSEDSSDNLLGE
jgi:hypothetical protein